MIAVLGLSLLIVWVTTHLTGPSAAPAMATVALDGLAIDLPEHWRRQTRDAADGESSAVVMLSDPEGRDRTLQIAPLDSTPPRTPIAALEAAAQAILAEPESLARYAHITRFRTGLAVGVSAAIAPRSTRPASDLLAVITQDGRKYWLIYLSTNLTRETSNQGDVRGHLMADQRLFEAVVNSATLTTFQSPDSPPDRPASSHLPNVAVEGATAYRHHTDPLDQSVYLIPLDPSPHLQWIRYAVAPDLAASTDPNLAPQTLLAQQFAQIHGRNPAQSQFDVGQFGGWPAWRLTITDGRQTGLARQLMYVRLPAGRAALIELLAEPRAAAAAFDAAKALVPPLAQHFTLHPDLAGKSPEVTRALDRGRTIVQWQIEHLADQPIGQPNYYLLQTGTQTLGGYIDIFTAPAGADAPAILHRAASMLISGQILLQETKTNADASAFQQITQQAASAVDDQRRGNRWLLVRSGDRLTFQAATQFGPDLPNWELALPDPFTPPIAEDRWPTNPPASFGPPALIWMRTGSDRPMPCWVRYADTRLAPADQPPHTLLLASPVMSLDADRLALDSDGRIVRYDQRWDTGQPTGVTWTTVTRVSRQQMLAVAAATATSLAQGLEQLEQELLAHD